MDLDFQGTAAKPKHLNQTVATELQLNKDLYHKLLTTEQSLRDSEERLEACQQQNKNLTS